ncbi:MAG: urea ABC transporter ATP-binding subunit UrtE [Gammaproteobacteria bacterium]|nr:urea ABC transporter ATP-binding subunit UrtE [Gammaproteobacteria bacterium]
MLIVEHLNHYYGGSHSLRDVSFEIPMGGCTALLGRNGMGKSTLLKCLMGVLPTRSGAIRFNDRDITDSASHVRAGLGMAYVPQGREIFARLTVEENLLTGMAAHRGKSGRAIPGEIFEMFPVLKDMRQRRGGDLSGGQQQQLAIGRALMMRPRLLMLDEPTEGIQPSIIKDIERVIRALADRGDIAILLVEQYYDFAKALADRYIVLARGEVAQTGSGDEMEADNVRRFLAV